MSVLTRIVDNLQAVRQQKPLIHHLTNYVTVTDCANITLALGGSPVMADDIGEVEEMVSFASALVLNIGTLNARTINSMLVAGKAASARAIPIVLDPVGVGATRLRTETTARIISEVRPSVIRGNMSEIKLIAGDSVAIKGVDSVADEAGAQAIAAGLARKLDCIVAITGKRDVISNGVQTYIIDNGHEMLSQVTGTGCMTTSLVGTYCGASQDWFSATAAGIMSMGIAGELARESLQAGESIGTFKTRLFDTIYNLDAAMLRGRGRIEQLS